jgi:hypothetical protein
VKTEQGRRSRERRKVRLLLICLLLSISSLLLAPSSLLFAGDAVAVGYNADGIWTAVTYYSSSTPKGGRDYKNRKEAEQSAIQDLRRRSEPRPTKTTILSSSDSTGFVAVARGSDKTGGDINVVGRGKSQTEADEQAFAELVRANATTNQKIVYRYFSHGADSSPSRTGG